MGKSRKSLGVGVCLAAVVVSASCSQVFAGSADQAFNLSKQRHYKEAILYYDKAILESPKKAALYLGRAEAYVNTGQYQQGLDDCNVAILLDGKSGAAYYCRGQAYEKLGQAMLAKADKQKAKTLGYVETAAAKVDRTQ